MEAQEDVYLPISQVAEVAYCPHNFYYRAGEKIDLTDARMVQGSIAERKRDMRATIMREGKLQVRSVTVSSDTLGVIGVIDILEEGEFPCPVEYKTGSADEGLYERVQPCLQAMCLEDTLGRVIPFGYLYYAGSRRRVLVDFDHIFREKTLECVTKARRLMDSPIRPEPVNDWRCSGCSLLPIYMPAEDCGPSPRLQPPKPLKLAPKRLEDREGVSYVGREPAMPNWAPHSRARQGTERICMSSALLPVCPHSTARARSWVLAVRGVSKAVGRSSSVP
jgi:CRISPR-associated protein Cas1